MLPPKLTASDIVTKSFAIAPCVESVTVSSAEPSVAEKVILFVDVLRVGVMSNNILNVCLYLEN